jgi:hypothetical protein
MIKVDIVNGLTGGDVTKVKAELAGRGVRSDAPPMQRGERWLRAWRLSGQA